MCGVGQVRLCTKITGSPAYVAATLVCATKIGADDLILRTHAAVLEAREEVIGIRRAFEEARAIIVAHTRLELIAT